MPAFALLLGGAVAGMLWGLFTIDGLLARAADDQRQTSADYVAAIVQRSIDLRSPRPESLRATVEAAMSDAIGAVRRPPRAVALTSAGIATVST